MLQIRLSKGGGGGSGGASGDGGGSVAGKSTAPVETVRVACPDHLVLADLPVAKSLGTITASTVKSVGRRARRHHGERVHFCVSCNFPIAIYGRLIPCEHAFCLACARTDSSCYFCEERIQKIQTIKLMMEEMYICGAPHCLKSFLKRSDFEAHVHATHRDLLDKDEPPNETDAQKQPLQPETSTARAPPDREDRPQWHQSRPPHNWIPPPPSAPPPPYQQSPDFPPMNYSFVPYAFFPAEGERGQEEGFGQGPWGAGPFQAEGFGNLELDSLSVQPPLPLQPPPLSQQQQQLFNRGRDTPPGFGWQSDKRGQE